MDSELPGGHQPNLLGGWLELGGAVGLLGAWFGELWFVDMELSVQWQTVAWGHGCPLLMRITEDSWSVEVENQDLEQQKPQHAFPLQATAVLCGCPCSISVGVPHQPSCWTPRFS